MPLLILCLLFLCCLDGSGEPGVLPERTGDAQGTLSNTWSARTSTGRTLTGRWNAVVDPQTGTVTGSWTLDDAKGKALAGGGWSAAKSSNRWTGTWRSVVSGSTTEYSGTWDADVDLKPDASLADLFKAAIQTAASGSWRAGRQSGAWSIRVAE